MALNQFCGCFAMLNFTAMIFKESGSTMSPNVSSIIVGGIQIIGSMFPTFLVDRLGRKLMMVTSAIGTSVGLAALGGYMLLKFQGFNVESFNWIPLVAFSFTIFIGRLDFRRLYTEQNNGSFSGEEISRIDWFLNFLSILFSTLEKFFNTLTLNLEL